MTIFSHPTIPQPTDVRRGTCDVTFTAPPAPPKIEEEL